MDKNRQLDDFFGLETNTDKDENPDPGLKKSGIKEFLIKKSFTQKVKLLPKVLSNKERFTILGFLVVIFLSLISIPVTSYYHFTTKVPDSGGSFTEGIIGEPRHINPLLAQSDADRDLVRLIYSGLLKYNGKGKLVPDMAKSYEVSPDELNYTFYLKENLLWHDGQRVSADDILFTIQTAKNPDYGSSQRINWQGVDVEKVNDLTVILKIKNPYAQFLNNLTLPILPKHIWGNIKPINFALSELNLKPIGSGPYYFNKLQKDTSGAIKLYELRVNESYYDFSPLIDKIAIRFYASENELINAFNQTEVDNIGFISAQNIDKLKYKQRLIIEQIKMPRYFALFFNQNQSESLSNKDIRLALTYATNKTIIVDEILGGNGIIVESPMMEGILESSEVTNTYDYSKEKASELLDNSGWSQKNENGIAVKEENELTIKLTTSTWPELINVANMLKEQWKEIGVQLEIESLPTPELQQAIKERNYQILLFGEILNLDPDPFSLWHSSQKKDPGLNLSLYDNKDADKLLEEARKTLNPIERLGKYDEFKNLVINDIPAIFLYSPHYLYGHTKKVNGFNTDIMSVPADRFLGIDQWYTKTKRTFK